jgi:hypothetical protein
MHQLLLSQLLLLRFRPLLPRCLVSARSGENIITLPYGGLTGAGGCTNSWEQLRNSPPRRRAAKIPLFPHRPIHVHSSGRPDFFLRIYLHCSSSRITAAFLYQVLYRHGKTRRSVIIWLLGIQANGQARLCPVPRQLFRKHYCDDYN